MGGGGLCTENRAIVVAERHTGSPLNAQWRREGLSEPKAPRGRPGGPLVPRVLLATSARGGGAAGMAPRAQGLLGGCQASGSCLW